MPAGDTDASLLLELGVLAKGTSDVEREVILRVTSAAEAAGEVASEVRDGDDEDEPGEDAAVVC